MACSIKGDVKKILLPRPEGGDFRDIQHTAEDHAAIQPMLSQIQIYPLSQFDGKMKTKDWSKMPSLDYSRNL